MRISTLLICSALLLVFSSCNRDTIPPAVTVTEPAYDGKNIQFGDVFFVEFEAVDDAEDGGLWRVELRGADGITPKTAQAGLGPELRPETSSLPLRSMPAHGQQDP